VVVEAQKIGLEKAGLHAWHATFLQEKRVVLDSSLNTTSGHELAHRLLNENSMMKWRNYPLK
jgi:hypothetical protein